MHRDPCPCDRRVFIAIIAPKAFKWRILLTEIAHIIVRPARSFRQLDDDYTLNCRKTRGKKGDLRLPRDVARMATRIIEVILEAVKSVPIVPFGQRFRCLEIPPVVH